MNEFSIILPVKNGGDYLKRCVSSILAQTIPHFNLIILDSGSTDGTVEWVRSLQDPRIVFYPSLIPLTIEENWGRICTVRRNEWMTIIGHDDLMNPDFLETINELILKYPDASLFTTHFDFISATGEVIKKCKQMPEVQSEFDFFEKILQNDIDAVGLVMRSSAYDAAGGFPLYPGLLFADYVIWIELTRLSYKVTSPKFCLSYRLHRKSTTATSGEQKYHKAYHEYITYLSRLKKQDPRFAAIINRNVHFVLRSRCLEFSKRLLNTKMKDRKDFKSVAALVRKHQQYADLLIDNNHFNPGHIFKVRLAVLIDSIAPGRYLYQLLRSLFR